MPGSTHTSGTSTPTRSCLKHSHHHQHTLDAACCSTRKRPGVKPQLVTKSVSFDGHEPQHVYVADYDYDRQSVPVAAKLSYEDILELKMLKIHMMCPRNTRNCDIVPVGILPLLPSSNPPSPASSAAPTPPHVDSPTATSHDEAYHNDSHLTPLPSSSDEDHSPASDSPPPLMFRSSFDNDPADPTSPSTPKKRSLSPARTRKMAQHTSPSQPLARDVPSPSELLSSLRAHQQQQQAPKATGAPVLPTFQIGPSTHRSPSDADSDSDDSDHQRTPPKRDARKPPQKQDAQDSDEDEVVAPPFGPPPCRYIQPSSALLSQPLACFSLAQPVQASQPTHAPPKVPLFPFMPLLPTPPSSSPTTPADSHNSSPQSQSPASTPPLMPMHMALPPLGLTGVPSPGLVPPSPFSLYPSEVTNPRRSSSSSSSRNNSLLDLAEKARAAAAKNMDRGTENPWVG